MAVVVMMLHSHFLISIYFYNYVYLYTYIYIYIFVCVYVCVFKKYTFIGASIYAPIHM